jgi:hypothetical protein
MAVNSTSGGRLGGGAGNSIGKHYTKSASDVPGAMKSNFSTGQGMATSRQHPTNKNPDNSKHTS